MATNSMETDFGGAVDKGPNKHPSFYFPDGNIILSLKDNTSGSSILFRIFKSQLAKHSQVFSDMLSVAVPSTNGQETFEDCEVISLTDDPRDLSCIFELLWDVPNRDPPLSFVLGTLRISVKYIFSDVQEWCLATLRQRFPTDPDEIIKNSHFEQWREGSSSAQLIIAGYACDLPEFLPYAYYALATEDWTDSSRVEEIGLHRLGVPELVKLAVGRAFLQKRLGTMIDEQKTFGYRHNLTECRGPTGGNTRPCQSLYERYWRTGKQDTARYLRLSDPIMWIKEEKTRLVEGGEWFYCPSCTRSWGRQSDVAVRELFDAFCEASGVRMTAPATNGQ